MGRLEAVKSCRLFSGMQQEAVERLAGFFEERDFEAGGLVFAAGDRGSSMFIVESGMVSILAGGEGVEETVLGRLVPGEHFGTLSMLQGGSRLVTARAEAGTGILELTQDGLLRLRDHKAELAFRLLLLIARDVAVTMRDNEEFLKGALAARLGRGSLHDA